jgi:hypothetical protein
MLDNKLMPGHGGETQKEIFTEVCKEQMDRYLLASADTCR